MSTPAPLRDFMITGLTKADSTTRLMLRQPCSKYENKRSGTLLKVKTFYDAEARVVGHEPGKVSELSFRTTSTSCSRDETDCFRGLGNDQGRLEGLLGSLVCVMEDEQTEFKVGSGFDDARRAQPPPVRLLIGLRAALED